MPAWRKGLQRWPLIEVDTHTMDALKPLLMQLAKRVFSSKAWAVGYFVLN